MVLVKLCIVGSARVAFVLPNNIEGYCIRTGQDTRVGTLYGVLRSAPSDIRKCQRISRALGLIGQLLYDNLMSQV